MELTLTGGSTLSDNDSQSTPLHANLGSSNNIGNGGQVGSLPQSHNHSHSHGHNHSHSHGNHGQSCCSPHSAPRPVVKIDASTLLPTKEQVQRFKTDRNFRLNVLSNVVRGGPYALFIDLLAVLVSDGEIKKSVSGCDDKAKENEAALNAADPTELAEKLDGYGADGHTLCHWCAKRGEHILQ